MKKLVFISFVILYFMGCGAGSKEGAANESALRPGVILPANVALSSEEFLVAQRLCSGLQQKLVNFNSSLENKKFIFNTSRKSCGSNISTDLGEAEASLRYNQANPNNISSKVFYFAVESGVGLATDLHTNQQGPLSEICNGGSNTQIVDYNNKKYHLDFKVRNRYDSVIITQFVEDSDQNFYSDQVQTLYVITSLTSSNSSQQGLVFQRETVTACNDDQFKMSAQVLLKVE